MKSFAIKEMTEMFVEGLKWGIERESLRLDSNGDLADTMHPDSLSLPFFTRDFAESQLEIITRPHNRVENLYNELLSLTEWADSEIGNERLWPYSMPPQWDRDQKITLAQLDGIENLYRKGLALRYGIKRQLISGIHINVSLSDDLFSAFAGEMNKEQIYFKLTRYLYSRLPLMITLFGASPYSAERPGRAFSWRNSPFGYGGTSYRDYLNLSGLSAYIKGIENGLRRESSSFSRSGLWNGKERLQINTKIFQSEKEFYAPIRIKGTNGLISLKKGDISRLEIRIPDLDPFEKTGISLNAMRLMEMIIISGLISEQTIDNSEIDEAYRTADILSLSDPLSVTIPEKIIDQFQMMKKTPEILDKYHDGNPYTETFHYYLNQLRNAHLTLSGRIAMDLKDQQLPQRISSIWQRSNHSKGENYVLTV